MKNLQSTLFVSIFLASSVATAQAADNQLTAEEKAQGWQLIFNGKDDTGWKTDKGEKIGSPIVDGTLLTFHTGGYNIVYEKPLGDFILKFDVKCDKGSNSGVFLRMGDIKDPVQTGIEVQMQGRKGHDMHDFGSIYDLVAPTKDKTNPPGEWNSVTITCKGPVITVEVNGEQVSRINCDEWTQPGKRLDGSKSKFEKAIKDFPHRGHLGLQDHGGKTWYKNIKLKEL